MQLTRLVIGSRGLGDILKRSLGKDIDLVMTFEALQAELALHKDNITESFPLNNNHWKVMLKDGLIYDIEIAWPGSTGVELLQLVKQYRLYIGNPTKTEVFASLPVSFALKLTHRFKPGRFFEKTRLDIKAFREAGIEVPVELEDWMKRRAKETYAALQFPKLNTSASNFFTDNVKYVYVHDTIHLGVAKITGIPAYKEFQVDGAEVLTSKEKFFSLPIERQLDSVMEEAYVLALERHQIPNHFRPDPAVSFHLALDKVCTTISSGWWRTFAYDHYTDVMEQFDRGYVSRFMDACVDGIVKRVEVVNG